MENYEEDLNPLASLLRLSKSLDFHDGEMVIRSLHETLQYVLDSPKDIKTVVDVMTSLSTNHEPVLRTDLMEQVPQIAFLCHDHPDKLGSLVTKNLVPMVVTFLTDNNDMVRKTSQAALLVLLEQELVSHNDVHTQVCPVILELTEPDAMDYFKTEAVALMSKMAPLVGREMTERFFMQRFNRLCSDTLFQVRKVCAANFGEFSGVVGTADTEAILLPYFLTLCEDGVWGVRKACADVFMVVSCACSLDTRKTKLSPLFVSLLSDDSRWVRLAAFQNLGPFISTFADPSVTGLHYNDQGILYIGPSPQDNHSAPPLDADSIVNPENIPRKEGSPSPATEDSKSGEDSSPGWSDFCLENSIQIENSSLDRGTSASLPGGGDQQQQQQQQPEKTRDGVDPDIKDIEVAFTGLGLNGSDGGVCAVNEEQDSFQSSPFSSPCSASSGSNFVGPCPPLVKGDCCPGLSQSPKDDPSFNELNFWRVPLPDLDLEFLQSLHLEPDPPQSQPTPQKQQQSPPPQSSPPSEPQQQSQCSETSENACVEESEPIKDTGPVNIIVDDVQAKFEALAASLAESIFCNEPTVEGDSPQDPAEGSREESLCLDTAVDQPSLGQDEENSLPEKKLTYAEICASAVKFERSSSLTTTTAATSTDPAITTTTTTADPEKSEVCSESSSSSAEAGSSQDTSIADTSPSRPPEEPCESGSSDCSKGIHNLPTFYNLSIAKDNDPFNIYRSYRESQKSLTINININQDIVPKNLLEHYISMTDPARAETVDDEITRHCAYSLPAVALTLGRRYWSLLRETYETLSTDLHWKVRRTLAFSIHELALILGEELAQKDLLPVFEGFIKDLDEVRIGVLKHLAPFLKMLPPSQRKLFLPRLSEFLNPDNVNNWRFRLELALQLAPISELFSSEECWTHICPITFDLMADKVVQIRRTCYGVLSQLARHLMVENEETYVVPFSQRLVEQFALADTWTRRQSYVYVVGQIIEDDSLPLYVVCSLFLPTFLDLARDKVPNIRLVIAKIINSSIMPLEYFHQSDVDSGSRVKETLLRLQNDSDRDVQYFASHHISTEILECREDSNFY